MVFQVLECGEEENRVDRRNGWGFRDRGYFDLFVIGDWDGNMVVGLREESEMKQLLDSDEGIMEIKT
ncbi:unnamed protein product [Paramecium octaurelia]|uniref:Uncharacterized protein n=1 Tax=Paramecium octaurelia TaxID=43137 RepID=A0A8S1YG56_PAROT|nr:unnamed protein product [Paramecium octaurelia]